MGPSQAYQIVEILKNCYEGIIGKRYTIRKIRDCGIPIKEDDILSSRTLEAALGKVIERLHDSKLSFVHRDRMSSLLLRFSRDTL